ncbi:unnamed protein product [Prorocentrum cordatum]|uniref:Uncharacterized protein n=1 Tax=Prorocentrum cordatum TaxID=2364126 RepID=A0ABN9UK29_9DINO|nr:unnamed protein product [Polarella glacialis]
MPIHSSARARTSRKCNASPPPAGAALGRKPGRGRGALFLAPAPSKPRGGTSSGAAAARQGRSSGTSSFPAPERCASAERQTCPRPSAPPACALVLAARAPLGQAPLGQAAARLGGRVCCLRRSRALSSTEG